MTNSANASKLDRYAVNDLVNGQVAPNDKIDVKADYRFDPASPDPKWNPIYRCMSVERCPIGTGGYPKGTATQMPGAGALLVRLKDPEETAPDHDFLSIAETPKQPAVADLTPLFKWEFWAKPRALRARST